MKAFLDLVRWRNLVIIALTMILMRYAVIAPLINKLEVILVNSGGQKVPMVLQFHLFNFILLVLATSLITAGGYVINDYFDIKTDLINRGKVIVGTKIPRRKAMMWHLIFTTAGVIIGFYISWRAGYLMFGAFFLLVSGLLYFYSASYKRQFLIGNLIVALLTGMVPMIVVFFEWPALFRFYTLNAISVPDIDFIMYWVGGFALFAFLTTLIREIIKDIEDFEGDIAYGRNTIPVVIGITQAKVFSIFFIILTIFLLYLTWYFYINDLITLIYLTVAIILPLVFVIYKVVISSNRKQIHTASNYMKIIMLTGILYSLVAKVILTLNLF